MIAGCRRRSQRFCRPSKGGRYGVSGEWHEDNITPRYSQGWGVASRVDSDPFGPKSVSAHISIESNGTSPHPHIRRVGSGRVASGSPRSLQAPPGWSRSARRPPPRRPPAVRTGTGCRGRPSASVARCRERARPVPRLASQAPATLPAWPDPHRVRRRIGTIVVSTRSLPPRMAPCERVVPEFLYVPVPPSDGPPPDGRPRTGRARVALVTDARAPNRTLGAVGVPGGEPPGEPEEEARQEPRPPGIPSRYGYVRGFTKRTGTVAPGRRAITGRREENSAKNNFRATGAGFLMIMSV